MRGELGTIHVILISNTEVRQGRTAIEKLISIQNMLICSRLYRY